MFSIETNRITTWGELYHEKKGGQVAYIPGIKGKGFCRLNGIYYGRRNALTDGRTKHDFLRSDDFMQCIGVLGVSEKLHHQLAHICPGKWVARGVHTTHLLRFYRDNIVDIFKEWRQHAAIKKNGLHLFGGSALPGSEDESSYQKSVVMLGEILHDIFGFEPQIAHGPSHPGERQFIRVEENRARILIGNFAEEGCQE